MKDNVYSRVLSGTLKTKEQLEREAEAKQQAEADAPKNPLHDEMLRTSWAMQPMTLEFITQLHAMRSIYYGMALLSRREHLKSLEALASVEVVSRVLELINKGKVE